MKASSRITAGLAAAAVLAGAMALPATAADTTATVAVTKGTLSLSAPETFDLGEIVPGQTASGVLTGITVTDDRAGELGWVASVSVSDFTGTQEGNVLSAEGVTYAPGQAVATGTSTVTPTSVTAGNGTVQTAESVRGNNTAVWDATLSVTAPSDSLNDTYTAKIVHSVA